jgi:polyvinyl alcohol dehydrogenase (cytochrome)
MKRQHMLSGIAAPSRFLVAALFVMSLFSLLFTALSLPASHAYAATGDWPGYLFDDGHSGFNGNETVITTTTAPNLKLKWIHTAAGSITDEPVEANNLVYWGSWDNGTEHTTDLNNHRIWTYNTGVTADNNCSPPSLGIGSTSTIATVTINGTPTSVDFFGGGTPSMYALNALTGKLIWRTTLASSLDYFLWSSPEVYNGSVYEGVASVGDCPLIRGQLVQMNAATGAIQHIFNTVPTGCIGASIWSSPAIDAAAGTVYVSTGNQGSCSSTENYAIALIELNASTLSVIGSWQVPASQQIGDGDFGASPTLFTTSSGTPMVGLENKNGKFYAFKRDAISSGPVWTATIATSRGSISTASWDGHTLYVGGSGITINGASCKGSVRALNPDNGALIWQHCLNSGPVIAGVISVPGLVIVEQGNYLMIIGAASGQTLFRYQDTGGLFDGPASVSNGVLYVGNGDGKLYAFAP